MPRATLNVSELDVSVDAEGVVRIANVPPDALVVIDGRTLGQLLTSLMEYALRRDDPEQS